MKRWIGYGAWRMSWNCRVTTRLVEERSLGSLDRKQVLSRLERLGLLSPLLTVVHAPELDNGEVERLSSVGASVVHCARSAMKLGLSECPAAALKRHNVNWALGTDAAACSNDLDMLGEMRTAALHGARAASDAFAHSHVRLAARSDTQRSPGSRARRSHRLARRRASGRTSAVST